MRVAVFAAAFPKTSTTFVLDQVTGLLDRGHDVHVFARPPPAGQPVHADFLKYGLAERTHHWHGATRQRRNLALRTLRLLSADPTANARVMFESFNAFRHGVKALGASYWSYGSTVMSHGSFDVVLAQFGPLGRLAVMLRDMGAFDAPIATTWLGYDLTQVIQQFGSRYYADLFRKGDVHLPLCDYFRSRLVELGCPADKIRIHRLGVDVDRFDFSPRSLGAGETLRIVSVARLAEKKGIDVALRALGRVAKRGIRFEYHLVGDGPDRAMLERLRDELGLGAVTTMHGSLTREQSQAVLSRCHLYLAPSVTAHDGDQEGTPVALMEAMAVGLPVLSTLHSGIPEMIEDGVSGFLVPERDDSTLADRIVKLASEPALWPAFGRAARETVTQRYSIGTSNDNLSALLTRLAGDYRPSKPKR
jgi:colanic acid/amylovoran biosynthesis glycosyltransferase